jgi:arylsulfatase
MAKSGKPNILFIMADDIGWFNLSCYNHGIMGYRTPNLDRIAREGAMFTDFYGQQSCTAGRAAFITGQSPIRTGLTKVGMPGATLGLSAEDPSVGQFMKSFGYATGQFGKNHLRQPLPPQRRRRTGISELPEGSRVPQEIRSARRSQMQGERQGRCCS